MAFTIRHLDTLQPKEKPYREFEGKTRAGFGVQVSTGGKVSFIYLYRTPTDNKQRVMTLGAYNGVDRSGKALAGGMSLKDAYGTYDQWKRVRDGGRDPQTIRDERLSQEESNRKAETARLKLEAAKGSVRQLLDAYIGDLKANNKRSWKNVQGAVEANVYKLIPEATKAKDVTPDDIRAVLAEIIQRDAMVYANRVRAYLSAAFAFGIQWDNDSRRHFEPLKFGIKTNPVRDVPKPLKSEKPRDRALSEAEVKQVWDALVCSRFHRKTISSLLLLFALGGQRVEEVLGILDDDVDFVNRLVTLLDTKNGTTHVVPFGDVAEPLLKERMLDTNSAGALFGKVKGNRAELMDTTTLSHVTTKVCHRLNIEHFQPKDIRRTVKTLMGFAGIKKTDRDRFQNHALTDVSSRHYDRYEYLAEKRQVMAVWDAYLKTVLAGAPQTNILPFRVVNG